MSALLAPLPPLQDLSLVPAVLLVHLVLLVPLCVVPALQAHTRWSYEVLRVNPVQREPSKQLLGHFSVELVLWAQLVLEQVI